jgi:beta-glucosidase
MTPHRLALLIATLALPACVTLTTHAEAAQAASTPAQTAQARPWMDASLPAARRVALLLAAMSADEKRLLLVSYWPDRIGEVGDQVLSAAERAAYASRFIPGSAGYVPGVARLGIPEQFLTDASLGVRNATLPRTGLPSSLATAASWDPEVAEAGGRMIGDEARRSGFNVMLAGGVNLDREPRNGRNFEYSGEDPLLAGVMGGAAIRGIQSNHIISTIKHFALNAQETGRHGASAQIGEAAARMSDYLAFELAIEQSSPGSVMCAYNRINDIHACHNADLLNGVLKRDWAYRGYVMSDWGGVYSTVHAANAGLDQQSGYPFDRQPFFKGLLKDAIDDGAVPARRLDDMAGRVLWAMFDKGLFDTPRTLGGIDLAAHARVAQASAEAAMVLLRNEGALLPLAAPKSVAVIGSFADVGVLAGGGSSVVTPVGGNAVAGLQPEQWPGPMMWHPSSPLKALRALLPRSAIAYQSGFDIAGAASAAAASEVAIVFVHQWAGEDLDVPLGLKGNQDELVKAVAAANPNTVVVVESGGAVLMPWAGKVKAILQAWYPGTAGGAAIARVLTGAVNPSGRLPISFPASEAQLVRAQIDGKGKLDREPFTVRYTEGAAVGYKWHELKGLTPLFAFGHGLGYSSFGYANAAASPVAGGRGVRVRFTIRNQGQVAGREVGQVYVAAPNGAWEAPRRLGGFVKVGLKPGESREVAVDIDPRLLASFDEATREWVVAAGAYRVDVAHASDDVRASVVVTLPASRFPAAHQ